MEPEDSLPYSQASWASPIQSTYPHPTSWRSILILSTHLRLGLPSGPDILLHDKKEKTCLPIDIALLVDSNVNTKETEKLSKLKDLEIKVNSMWKVKTKIVPVITGALGIIKKALDHNLQLLPGHRSAKELWKITLMSTAHSNCRVLREIALICCWNLYLLQDSHLTTTGGNKFQILDIRLPSRSK